MASGCVLVLPTWVRSAVLGGWCPVVRGVAPAGAPRVRVRACGVWCGRLSPCGRAVGVRPARTVARAWACCVGLCVVWVYGGRDGTRLRAVPAGFVVLWRCPTLPQPVGCSTIGAAGLSFQVRNVAGRFPGAVTTTRLFVQHAPPGFGWGVWVDRGLYSGCGVVRVVCPARLCWVLFSVGQLVPVGSRAPRGASTSGLSTR